VVLYAVDHWNRDNRESMIRQYLACLAVLFCAGLATDAHAQANTVQSRNFSRWRAGDKCVADATKAFPDHDQVSLQKRDGQIDQCLAAAKLPARTHLAAPTEAPAIVEPPKED
jgi:hypothetical protein